jgi:hypothetical protein
MNQMFRSTLDMIPNGVMLIDNKTKKISFANTEMKSIVGGDYDHFGTDIMDLIRQRVTQFVKVRQNNSNDSSSNVFDSKNLYQPSK